jgi:hypothetical protein
MTGAVQVNDSQYAPDSMRTDSYVEAVGHVRPSRASILKRASDGRRHG